MPGGECAMTNLFPLPVAYLVPLEAPSEHHSICEEALA